MATGMLINAFVEMLFMPNCANFGEMIRTGDLDFARRTLVPAMRAIVEAFRRGTKYNIHQRPDGLVWSGDPGTQLTWMDARSGDTVFTPRYGCAVEIVRPDAEAVSGYVASHGANAFYESIELRKRCCHIRKVEPLRRALASADAWITGLRRSQSATRNDLPERVFDEQHGIFKFNPLADWEEADVWQYLRDRDVPYNPLHDKGYPSIGCEPCTRAIRPGEDIRAGRWWWESSDSRECGLHVASVMDGADTMTGSTRA